jgi:hypothetical protein
LCAILSTCLLLLLLLLTLLLQQLLQACSCRAHIAVALQ